MAMRTLVSKLRIPAVASHRTPPTFRSFSTASQDKLGSTAARTTTKEFYPYVGHKAIFEPAMARQNRYRWCLTCLRLVRNYVALNFVFGHVQKPE